MTPIEAALDSLKSLKLRETPNYAKISKKYGCDRNTLSRRHRGVQGTMARKLENQRLLNNTQEKELVRYIDSLYKRGLPPSRQIIRNFTSKIGCREAGKSWADRFIKRWEVDLISRWTSGIDINRKRANSAFKYLLYFKLLRRKIKQYKVDPQHIYNMDEKGFLIGILLRIKRIFSKRRYEEGGIKQIIQDGNRK